MDLLPRLPARACFFTLVTLRRTVELSFRQTAKVNTQKDVSKLVGKMSESWMWCPLHTSKASQQG